MCVQFFVSEMLRRCSEATNEALTVKRVKALTKRPPTATVEISPTPAVRDSGCRRPAWPWKWLRFRWQRESVEAGWAADGAGPGELDLKEAREKAEGVQRLVQRGVDPRVEEQAAKADDRLVEKVLDRYLAEHVDKRNRRNSAKQNRQIIEARIRPVWRGRLISDLDRHAINALIKPIIVSRPALTHRVRSIISRWCRWMVEEDILDRQPVPGDPGAAADRRPRARAVNGRDPHLPAGLPAAANAGRRLLVSLLLPTGQRREEAAAMTWDEVRSRRQRAALDNASRTIEERQAASRAAGRARARHPARVASVAGGAVRRTDIEEWYSLCEAQSASK